MEAVTAMVAAGYSDAVYCGTYHHRHMMKVNGNSYIYKAARRAIGHQGILINGELYPVDGDPYTMMPQVFGTAKARVDAIAALRKLPRFDYFEPAKNESTFTSRNGLRWLQVKVCNTHTLIEEIWDDGDDENDDGGVTVLSGPPDIARISELVVKFDA